MSEVNETNNKFFKEQVEQLRSFIEDNPEIESAIRKYLSTRDHLPKVEKYKDLFREAVRNQE